MEHLISVATYSPLSNTVHFKCGRTHTFRGDLLKTKQPFEASEMLTQWARFKNYISNDEVISVPGFSPKEEENT